MAVLLLAEHNNRQLNAATAKTLSAALALGGDVDILVAGRDCGPVAEEAARFAGVRKVLTASAPHLEHRLAEETANLVVALMPGYTAFVAPATADGKNVAPRVAALIDAPQVSEITAVLAPNRFERPIYAGNAIQTVEAPDGPLVITVRPSVFPAAATGGGASIETISPPSPLGLSAFASEALSQSARPELGAARVVVSGGRGMQSSENFKILERIADKLGAAVGASRAAVDAGFAPNDYQVGQTGKVVAPELYIAVGISGAIQHLAGMKDAKVIVAINKDEEAPIFQVADYGLVGDLFQILPELETELDKART
ncbi:MAG: electron transfer flavoprotein subunit alpha/FixB family protein [Hyphomicrobiales bacterium]|nr:electron transfer flavoprotein subunit alpha/FixB family protein [Hyphomicrobiales bacterium]